SESRVSDRADSSVSRGRHAARTPRFEHAVAVVADGGCRREPAGRTDPRRRIVFHCELHRPGHFPLSIFAFQFLLLLSRECFLVWKNASLKRTCYKIHERTPPNR